MIFQIDIDEELLEPDYDDLFMVSECPKNKLATVSVQDSLKKVRSVRVADKIDLNSAFVKYSKFQIQTNSACTEKDRKLLFSFASNKDSSNLNEIEKQEFSRLVTFQSLDTKKPL